MTLLPFKLTQSGVGAIYALNNLQKLVLGSASTSIIQVRHAARKGTREKKKKAKVKTVVEKVGFIPHNQRDKEKFLQNRPKLKYDDSMKRDSTDNVFVLKYYKWPVYQFAEALQCHRETHHPEIYNKPNANLHVSVELNMQGEKKTRFVDNFTRIVAIPHKFDHGEERSVLVFCKTPEFQEHARDSGAQLCGGVELIKQVQNGAVSLQDFQFVLAHPEILPELVALRGLMKRKFPNPRLGTLDIDMGGLVQKFMHGINYSAKKDEYEKDFAVVNTVIGTLDMDAKHLEENYAALIRDIHVMKPKRDGLFISRCVLSSPPSSEKVKVEYEKYLNTGVEDSPDVVEEGERIAL